MAETTFENATIPVPEPDLTPDEMIKRATGMRQLLRDQQQEAERLGNYTEEVHQAFLSAGLYRVLQPRRFGGYAFPMETYLKIAVEIGRGDPGSAWCFDLGAHHALEVGSHWSAEAQRELFCSVAGDFIAAHRAGPGGTAVPENGGYRVSGRWRYSSGIPYSTHFIGGVTVPSEEPDGRPRMVNATVPRHQFAIEEGSWGNDESFGLQSSGSHTVLVEDQWIPAMFLVEVPLFGGADTSPGLQLHGDPLYLGRMGGYFHAGIVAPQVGAARAALDEYERLMRETNMRAFGAPAGPPVKRIESPDYQRNFGIALETTDAAEAILIRSGEMYSEYSRRFAEEGRPFSAEDDVRLWGQCQVAGRLAFDAVELLWRTADSSVVGRRGQRLQRYYRDVSMYRGHLAAQTDMIGPLLARLNLGLPMGPPFARPQPSEG
jgi:3-hydroxy-9,10-secoandrosta-1,3,5(10)-triene-9,17-dione monooxygenase